MPELKSIAIALVIMAFIGSGLTFLIKSHNQNKFDQQYGAQAGSVVLGARSFAAANRAAIITAVTAAGGNAVSYTVANATGTAQLQTTGAIDTSFSGSTGTGGTYCLEFRTYNGGTNIQGLLTVVGETAPLSSVDAGVAAQNAGTSYTGIINAAGVVVYPGGSQAISVFTGPNACAPAANAFAALITDGDIIGTTTWVCRTPIPNNGSCATMAQDFSLGGNNIASILNETGTGASQFATYTATTSISTPVIYETSDRAFKKKIKPIAEPCALLDPIHGRKWRRRTDDQADYGVIAQDVFVSMPELVTRNEAGRLQVNYNGLSAPIIECEKRDHQQLADLAAELSAVQSEIASLRADQHLAGGR